MVWILWWVKTVLCCLVVSVSVLQLHGRFYKTHQYLFWMKQPASLTLKLHIFGHIHEDHGREQIGDCLYVNASTCNGSFKPLNPPIVIDL